MNVQVFLLQLPASAIHYVAFFFLNALKPFGSLGVYHIYAEHIKVFISINVLMNSINHSHFCHTGK